MKQVVSGNVLPGSNPLQEKWTAAELSARLCKVLDFAAQAVCSLADEGFKLPDNTEQEEGVRPEKVIAETAFLLLVAHTYAHQNNDILRRITNIAEILNPHARSRKNFLAICLQPALALDYAQAHICLSKIGYPDEKFDALLQKSLSATSRSSRERPPHRMLEQEWVKRIWNADMYDLEIFRWSANNSALGKPMDLLHGTRDDMYAFTHALMYVSGFSLYPCSLPRGRSEILKETEAMLARCLDEQDYDLAGELLLAWPITGNTWSSLANFAFSVLMHVDDVAGFLPTPSTRLDTLSQLSGIQRQKYFYATAYHTVYVLGLLCAAALQPGCASGKNITVSDRHSGCAAELLKYLPPSAPHWRKLFNELKETEQDELSPMLLNIALYRRIKQRNYQDAFHLIQVADDTGLSDLPLPQQTAELLERLSMFL